jgi:hypothetical protein
MIRRRILGERLTPGTRLSSLGGGSAQSGTSSPLLESDARYKPSSEDFSADAGQLWHGPPLLAAIAKASWMRSSSPVQPSLFPCPT